MKVFGELSGYKVNENKSTILAFNLANMVNEEIAQVDLTLWHNTMRYLGVNITVPFSNETLIAYNLNPLIEDIKKQMSRWHYKELSWFGRIMALKIKDLPQILFVFRALVLDMPRKKLVEIQQIFNDFVWNKRKPKKSRILQQSRNSVGLEARARI